MSQDLLLTSKDGQYRVTSAKGVCGTGEFVQSLFELLTEHDMSRISNVTIFFNSNSRQKKVKAPSNKTKTERSFNRI